MFDLVAEGVEVCWVEGRPEQSGLEARREERGVAGRC